MQNVMKVTSYYDGLKIYLDRLQMNNNNNCLLRSLNKNLAMKLYTAESD